MMEPLPNCFSIWPTASSTALARSRSCLSSILSIGICVVSSEGSSILETCLAKVNGKSVNVEPEHTEHQTLRSDSHFRLSRAWIAESAIIGPPMPSPFGHSIAGLAVAWAADLVPGDRAWRAAPASASWYHRAGNGLSVACALLAMTPDLDLGFTRHRTYTHSIGAVIVV